MRKRLAAEIVLSTILIDDQSSVTVIKQFGLYKDTIITAIEVRTVSSSFNCSFLQLRHCTSSIIPLHKVSPSVQLVSYTLPPVDYTILSRTSFKYIGPQACITTRHNAYRFNHDQDPALGSHISNLCGSSNA
jgi:hypothetical protein